MLTGVAFYWLVFSPVIAANVALETMRMLRAENGKKLSVRRSFFLFLALFLSHPLFTQLTETVSSWIRDPLRNRSLSEDCEVTATPSPDAPTDVIAVEEASSAADDTCSEAVVVEEPVPYPASPPKLY